MRVPLFDSRRYLDAELDLFDDPRLSAASLAGVADHVAGAAAGRAGAGDGEEALLEADLAAALALRANLGSFAGGAPCSVANVAGVPAADLDLGLRAKDGSL